MYMIFFCDMDILKPYAFYMVDTLGVMYQREILRLFYLIYNIYDVIDDLIQYFKISDSRKYIKEISDMSYNKMTAFKLLIESLVNYERREETKEYFNSMKKFYCLNYCTKIILGEIKDITKRRHRDMIIDMANLLNEEVE